MIDGTIIGRLAVNKWSEQLETKVYVQLTKLAQEYPGIQSITEPEAGKMLAEIRNLQGELIVAFEAKFHEVWKNNNGS